MSVEKRSELAALTTTLYAEKILYIFGFTPTFVNRMRDEDFFFMLGVKNLIYHKRKAKVTTERSVRNEWSFAIAKWNE